MEHYDNNDLSVTDLKAAGYRRYSGQKLDVYFNAQICQHAAKCVQGNHEVFNVNQKPWIKVDSASATDVMEVVNRCPSGALKYVTKNSEVF